MVSTARFGRVGRRLLAGGLGAFVDPQTYKNLLYLLLAVPFGFLYYLLFGFGVIFGVLLSVVLVGIVLLFAALVGARLVARFERWLANALLGLDLRQYEDLEATEATGTRSRIRAYVDAPSTWRAIGFLSVKVPVAFLSLLGVFALATIVPLLAAPLRYPTDAEFGELNGEPVVWSIETSPEAALAGAAGAVALVVFVHFANGAAYVCGRMSAALLGETPADP